jgi:hypothetical protein
LLTTRKSQLTPPLIWNNSRHGSPCAIEGNLSLSLSLFLFHLVYSSLSVCFFSLLLFVSFSFSLSLSFFLSLSLCLSLYLSLYLSFLLNSCPAPSCLSCSFFLKLVEDNGSSSNNRRRRRLQNPQILIAVVAGTRNKLTHSIGFLKNKVHTAINNYHKTAILNNNETNKLVLPLA